MSFQRLADLDLGGRTVLVRVDLNVPMQDGRVSDQTRIDRAAETLRALLAAGARPVALSHFGRPKGRRVPEMSLEPLVEPLSEAVGAHVVFSSETIGDVAAAAIAAAPAGSMVLLENTRFHDGEEANDPAFAAALAALGDVYVNDAFSAAHRAHASTEALARLLPAAAGLSLEAELDALTRALEAPERPLAAVVGGAKVSTKLEVLGNLVDRVDMLIIGGGMANTFLAADGLPIGASLAEVDLVDAAAAIRAKAAASGCEILLPSDIVVAWAFEAHAPHEVISAESCPDDAMILDAGPDTVRRIGAAIARARTLVWNGPLGAFETPPFDAATIAAARLAGELTRAGKLVSVAGGGDTVAALNAAEAAESFSYVSTAGGAFLEWLEGKTLPGVAALTRGR